MNKVKKLQRKFADLQKLLIFRDIYNDNIIGGLIDIFGDRKGEEQKQKSFYRLYSQLLKIAEEENFKGDIWHDYLVHLFLISENVLALKSERYGQRLGKSLLQVARHDLQILLELFSFSLGDIEKALGIQTGIEHIYHPGKEQKRESLAAEKIEKLIKLAVDKDTGVEEFTKSLIDYYYNTGAGRLGYFSAFRWQGNNLTGIGNPDPVIFADIIGYSSQKKQLLANTERFIEGSEANNVLLFGDSGTGKSSSVKALVNHFKDRGLRLVEINRSQIKELPRILEQLTGRGLYFIIFMDDLSFANFETDYKYLKAVMEGGVEVKPDNVLFYATSNRRNLIKESWSERSEENGEIHLNDALEEKHSLVERFGITIHYGAPSRQEYLSIVRQLAAKSNLDIEDRELTERALQWEQNHNGRSGRLARQFLKNISN